jgi:hypothetical protein
MKAQTVDRDCDTNHTEEDDSDDNSSDPTFN